VEGSLGVRLDGFPELSDHRVALHALVVLLNPSQVVPLVHHLNERLHVLHIFLDLLGIASRFLRCSQLSKGCWVVAPGRIQPGCSVTFLSKHLSHIRQSPGVSLLELTRAVAVPVGVEAALTLELEGVLEGRGGFVLTLTGHGIALVPVLGSFLLLGFQFRSAEAI